MAAPSTWVPGKGSWQARLQSPWLMHERFVALQLVEVRPHRPSLLLLLLLLSPL